MLPLYLYCVYVISEINRKYLLSAYWHCTTITTITWQNNDIQPFIFVFSKSLSFEVGGQEVGWKKREFDF